MDAPIRWSTSIQESGRVELLIKRKPGGRFSDWLFDERRSEREVAVFGPLGRAVFRPHEGRNFICIAGGSGIAGMMSILECAVQADYFRDHKAAVFFGVRTLQDAFYLESLSRYVAQSHGNLEVTIALSDEAGNGARFMTLSRRSRLPAAWFMTSPPRRWPAAIPT